MSEQIGKHKGAVETLLHEKKELSRILQIVNSQLQRHLSALEEQGIDTDRFIEEIQQGEDKNQGSRQRRDSNQKRGNQKNSGRSKNRGSKRRKQQSGTEDTDELLEDESSTSNRDFNPNR